MLADMAIDLELSRWLTLRAAYEADQERPVGYYASVAKAFAADTANKTASNAVQVRLRHVLFSASHIAGLRRQWLQQ